MGMKIYEASGTFSPADYGLQAGDVLDVICVGGGSSGMHYAGTPSTASAAGGASSFGGVSSASGPVMAKGEPYVSDVVARCGCGAGGYLPGVAFNGGNGGTGVGLSGTLEDKISPYCNPGGPGNRGAAGGNNVLFAPGGNGYGAGGGGYGASGQTACSGGDAGRIAIGSVVLDNTDPITVTVGTGGVNRDTCGADGCVIVFW